MSWELEIAGQSVPVNQWSGPQGLRSGYRGPEPGSREFGAVNFTLYRDLLRRGAGFALDFDGSDDYAKLGSPGVFPAVMTVGFWIRKKSLITIDYGVAAVGGNGEYGAWVIEEHGGGLYFLQSTSGTNWETVAESGGLAENEWICCLAMNLGVEAKWWINDAESGTPQLGPASGTLWDPKCDLTLGCQTKPSSGNPGRYGDIELADVRIWLRALTFAQRTAYYNGGRITPNTIGGDEWLWLPTTEGSGSYAHDQSGNGRDLTLKGAGWTECAINGGREMVSAVERDALVTIGRDGVDRYRGVITGHTRAKRTIAVETMEAAARLNELDAGMPVVNGLANPQGYVYLSEQGRFRIWREADLPAVYSRISYPQTFLFDSYSYLNGTNLSHERTLLWTEQSAATLTERISDQANAANSGLIRGRELSLDGPSEPTLIGCRDDRGERVEAQWYDDGTSGWYRPFGLITREFQGGTFTILWRRVDNDLVLHQLVNHGLAVPLGRIPLGTGLSFVRSPDLYPDLHLADPSYSGSLESGPWEAGVPTEWPWILGFYLIAGKFTGGEYRQRAYVYSIDLTQARQTADDQLIEYQGIEISEVFTDQFRKYAALTGPSGYHTQTTPLPLWRRKSSRTGGDYTDRGDGGEIYWQGQRWLSEAAVDFRGAALGTVLGELSRALGCEWWIDAAGTLRMERMDRASRIVDISSRRILTDPVNTHRPSDPYKDLSLSGIPLPDYTRELLRIGLRNISTAQNRFRSLEVVAQPGNDFTLGAAVMLNGQPLGRIVAVEPTRFTDQLEIELSANDYAGALV